MAISSGYTPNNILRPTPRDPLEAARWNHIAECRRLLDGYWEQDLLRHRAAHFDGVRDDALGPSDLSSNPFKRIVEQLAVLYDLPPTVSHDDPAAGGLIGSGGLLDRGNLWSRMQRIQRWIIGCNEYLVRPHIDSDTGVPYFRDVSPDVVLAKADPDEPDRPIKICELRERFVDGERVFCWDITSIEDPDNPYYEIRRYARSGLSEFGESLTEEILGYFPSGPLYPYRSAEGRPVLPYVLYHASASGRLWDTYNGIEIVRGSLTAGVLTSFLVHALRDCSWPQRWAINVTLPGAISVEDGQVGPRVAVPADPASIIAFEGLQEGMQPMIGQFQAGADIKALTEAIGEYESRLAQYANLPASDIQRVRGAPRSGYSIALSNEGKRKAQQRYKNQQSRGDRELIGLVAMMLNGEFGSRYPETGYSIAYTAIEHSPSEAKNQREQIEFEMRLGMIGPIDAYQRLNPGATISTALAALENARHQNELIRPLETSANYSSAGRPSSASVVANLNSQVADGTTTREAAVEQLINILGFTREQSRAMIS